MDFDGNVLRYIIIVAILCAVALEMYFLIRKNWFVEDEGSSL